MIRHAMTGSDRVIYLSCRDLVTMLGVPKRTLLRWAKEDEWPTIGSHNHRRYDAEAAERSFTRRRVMGGRWHT